MKKKPAPLLNPGTLQPMKAEELNQVFCSELVKQELDEMSGLFLLSEEENKKAREEKKKLADRVDELEFKKVELEEEKKEIKSKHATEIFNLQMIQQGVARKTLSKVNVLPR